MNTLTSLELDLIREALTSRAARHRSIVRFYKLKPARLELHEKTANIMERLAKQFQKAKTVTVAL